MLVVSNLDTAQLIFNRLFSYGDYLWIGTQSGLYCYNTQNQFCILYQHNHNNPHSISSNFITDIDKNSSGDIIIGTRNGVNIYQRNDQFVTFSRGIQARSLNDNIVNRIFVDKNDNIQPCKGSLGTRRIDGLAGLLDAYVVYERNLEDYMSLI